MTSSRSALLAAAVEVFTERGYEAATVADIAERAGVTTGALYAHFRGKLDLLLQSLGSKSVDGFARDSLSTETLERRGGAAVVIGQNLARPPGREAVLLLDVIVAARRDPRLAATLRRLLGAKVREFTASTARGIDAGVIRPVVGSDDLARLMTVLAFGNLVLAAIDESRPSEDAFVRLMTGVLHGGDAGPRPDSSDPLLAVARSASGLRDARAGFESAVLAASRAGHSLRRIAEAAGVSHEQVRRIVGAGDGEPAGQAFRATPSNM